MYCKKCGVEISESNRFCPTCGYDQIGQAHASPAYNSAPPVVVNVVNTNTNTNTNNAGFSYPTKSKWAALLLCFFLGWLGVHRFYVGKVGTGLLYLLTGGLLGVGWLIDFISILFGGFRDKDRRRLE
jgi:hypothetical protein